MDKIIGLVKDFLQKQGYQRTFDVFKTERPIRKQPNKPEGEEEPAAHFIYVQSKTILSYSTEA